MRQRLFIALLCALALVVGVSGARSNVVWTGDFETGDFSQWAGQQEAASDRITIETDAAEVAQGSYSGRFQVGDGDSVLGGERSEVLLSTSATGAQENVEQWWGWKVRFAHGFTPWSGSSNSSWNIFTQFHHSGSSGQANIHFEVNGATGLIQLRAFGGATVDANQGVYNLVPFETSRFYQFVFHVKWSSDASVGFVEVWVDGVKVLPLTMRPTLYAGQVAYLKQGYYRDPRATTTNVLWIDDTRRGTSYADVAGVPAPEPEPQPTPEPDPVYATKAELDAAVAALRNELAAEVAALRSERDAEVAALRDEIAALRARVANLEARVTEAGQRLVGP